VANLPADDDLEFDDEASEEYEIHFEPRLDDLAARGISEQDFETALLEALEGHEQRAAAAVSEDDVPDLEDIELVIDGRTHRLGDLADIAISAGDTADLDAGDDPVDD
jgi:hypothetical protein